jgi:DNA-binding transcriptional LysR family regulator
VNLTRLQTFVEVVRRGTFAAAADALSFTPSAVSQQMSKLEAEAGARLVEREAGGVRLTEAGRLLHEHALAIVAAAREARAALDALQAAQVERLRLGACPLAAAAVAPRALRLLRRRLPATEVALEEVPAAAVPAAVAEGRLDVGVWVAAGGGPAAPAGGEARPSRAAGGGAAGVEGRPARAAGGGAAAVEIVLHREPLRAAIAADHALARLPELDAEALAATPRLDGDPRWRVSTLPALLALVAAGEGWALVPAPAAEPVPAGVVLRPLAGAAEWELRAARAAQDVLSVGTLAALDALRTAAAPPAVRRVA